MRKPNRAERRRASSKKKGGAQVAHTSGGQRLKAVQDEVRFNESLFKDTE